MTRPRSITVILLLVFATLANAIVPLSERLTHGNGREGGRTPRSHTSTFSERRESLFSSPLFRDPLMEWLDKLHVDVPDQSFSTRWVNIEIRNLTCTHFSILDIESDYKNDGSGENSSSPEISLTIWQVAAACNGFYKSTGGVGGEITAHLVVKENEAALQWTVAVLDEKSSTVPRVPNAVETVSCTTEFVVTGLHFSGSLSAKLIELFRGKIEHAVNSAVENQVCPVIVKKVDPLLSHYLQTTVEWLRPYLTPNISVRSSLAVREEYVDVYEEESNLEADSYIIDFGKDLPVLSSVLESLNTFVAAHLNDGFLPHSSYCGGFSEGINGVIHEILPAGLWKLPVSEQHAHLVLPGYAAIDLHMHNVTATGEGLSHWKNLTVLRPHGSSFFQTALEMTSNVSLTMAVTLQVMAVPGGMFRDEALQESFVVQIDAEGITAAADLSVHLRKDLFQNINAGSLLAVLSGLMSDKDLSMTPEAACLLESFQSLKSSGLHVVLSLLGLSISPLHSAEKSTSSVLVRNEELEKDMDELFDNITRLFLTVYRPLVTDAIAGLTRGPIQERLNDFLANKIKKSPGVNCTNRDDNSSDQSRWVNFTTVQPLHSLNALLSEETALSGINRYLDCVTDAISGIIRQPPNHVSDFLHSAVTERGVQSFFGLNSLLSSSQLRDFEIKHAGSIRKVELLLPLSDGFHLQSSLRLGSNNTDAAVRPQIFASIDFDNIIASLDFDSVPFNLSAAVNITVFLNNIDWEGGSVLHYDSRRFQQMKLSQLLSHGQCALVPADEFEFYRFDANQGFFEIVMNATLTIAGGDSLSTRHFSIDSKEFSEVQVLVSSVFEWSLDTAQDMVAAVYKTAHSRSASSCGVGHSAGPQPPAKKRKGRIESNTVLLIIAAIFIFAQPAILLVKRSQDAVNEEVSLGQQDDLAELLLHDEIFVDGFPTNQETPACLMFDAKVSEVARHLIPIFILVVIATLLASNLSVGATVDLMVSLDEREIRLPSLFMFSLFNTAKDMLDAKIYPLFLLVVVFSGVWPYVKLALMLAAWISPKSVLSSESRGELLLKLDALSKFSLVDTYVLVGKFGYANAKGTRQLIKSHTRFL